MDIGDQLETLTIRQRQFDQDVARHLRVDPVGRAAMERLIRDGRTTPTELARRLEISTAAMTLVLDRLESAGHVVREPHPSDRRKVLVAAVEESAQAAQERVAPLVEAMDALTGELTPAERATVSGFLTKMITVYDQALARGGTSSAPSSGSGRMRR